MKTKVEVIHTFAYTGSQDELRRGTTGYIDGYVSSPSGTIYALVVSDNLIAPIPLSCLKTYK